MTGRWYWEDVLEGRESQPQQEDKLEGVVEGEPVDDVEETLKDAVKKLVLRFWLSLKAIQVLREEGENDPVLASSKLVSAV